MGKRKPTQPVKDPRQSDLEEWLKEKATQKPTPKLAWFELCKLYAEADKLHAEGSKLYAEGNKLHAEGDKLRAEDDKLYVEGDKLYAEGDKLYAEGKLIFIQAVIDHHGPKTLMHWTPEGCRVTDREYKLEEPI